MKLAEAIEYAKKTPAGSVTIDEPVVFLMPPSSPYSLMTRPMKTMAGPGDFSVAYVRRMVDPRPWRIEDAR